MLQETKMIVTETSITEAVAELTKEQIIQNFYKEIEGLNLTGKIKIMNQLRLEKEALQARKTIIEAKYDAIRLNIIPSAMEELDISTVSVDGVGRISLASDIYCSIPKEVQSKSWNWLREHGHGGIIIETINAGTLKATLKSIIKKGKEILPPTLFKVTPFTRASITKK
jgi:N12 class adenine-specific DNA methylase